MNKKLKRLMKRILKFFIESLAVVLIIYGVFSAGGYLKAKKDAKNQETTQQAENNQNKEQKPEEKKKLDTIELDKAMKNIISQYKANNEIGIVYKNFSTGYRFSEDDERYFAAASTIKVVYAMKIYDRINAGEIRKDDDIKYDSKYLEEGGGEITNQEKKDSYKLDYVIQNMIQYSDNTATKMLIGNTATATDILVKYFAKLGITLPPAEAAQNRITPRMMEAVWTKLYNERDKYQDLIKYLEASSDNEWIKQGIPDKKIASKYGGIDANMHDTAIVFGNQDYMLLIYTNNLKNSAKGIIDISREINQLTENNM